MRPPRQRWQIEPLVSIYKLAKDAEIPKNTMADRLHKLRKAHGGDWMVRIGDKWLVNTSRLRAAHPALFSKKYVSQEEIDTITETLKAHEIEIAELKSRCRALGAGIRNLHTRTAAGTATHD